jgi:hypothetical protein
LRKLEKVWECVVNANGNANCYLIAVQMLIFFDAQYKSLLHFLGGGEGGVCVGVSPMTACCCQKYTW